MALDSSDIRVGVVTAFLQLRDDGFFDTLNQAESALEDFENDANTTSDGLANVATTLTGWGFPSCTTWCSCWRLSWPVKARKTTTSDIPR